MITSGLLAAIFATTPAHACGGFFCSSGGSQTTTTTTTTQTGDYGLVPVVQDSERILFKVNGDGTTTTYVEVGYVQREDVDFAWLIPIPEPIDADSVQVTDADLFNQLELATAPAFTFQWQEQNTNYTYRYVYGDTRPTGCSLMGCAASSSGDALVRDSGFTQTTTTTSTEDFGVAVLQDAVVGPFAIEVLTADDALGLAQWLAANEYDLPDGAIRPLEHYIDGGMAFLGVKLAPDVPEGPVNTLVFTYPGEMPMIPLILTAIASADDLSITSWILADSPYVPANWDTTRDFTQETLPDGFGATDYLQRVEAATGAFDGKAFVLEYAGETAALAEANPDLNRVITENSHLVRYRGHISPWEMTLDPWFAPFPGLPPYSREHFVDIGLKTGPSYRRSRERGAVNRMFRRDGAALLLAPLALIGWYRRRRSS